MGIYRYSTAKMPVPVLSVMIYKRQAIKDIDERLTDRGK